MKTRIPNAMKTILSFTTILIILNVLTGCGFYYKVQTSDHPFNKEDLKTFIQKDKYFILHEKDTAWHISSIAYNDSTFQGALSVLPKIHMKYKTEKGNYRYKVSVPDSLNEKEILNEVHLYISNDIMIKDKTYNGKYSSVLKVNENIKNKARTARSWILPIIITPIAMPVFVITLVLISNGINTSMGGRSGFSRL